MSDGPLFEVEYRAFLNMWLCRFVFCGKANEPTLNHIAMADDLTAGHPIPLGKYLLGSVYHMLHQTTYLMHTPARRSLVLMAPDGLFKCGCSYTCTRSLVLISTTGISLHPTIRKEKLRSPKVAKLMEKLPQPYPLTRTSAKSLSFSLKVSPIPFGFLI
jgi:hypothetical protein